VYFTVWEANWPGSNITEGENAGKETLPQSEGDDAVPPSLNASAYSQGSSGPINFAPSQRTDKIKTPVWNGYTVVSGRLNVVKGLKRTNQIVSFGRSRHDLFALDP
jgi:hypothetical protein